MASNSESKLEAMFDRLVTEVERWAAENKDTDPTAAEVFAILNEEPPHEMFGSDDEWEQFKDDDDGE